MDLDLTEEGSRDLVRTIIVNMPKAAGRQSVTAQMGESKMI